MLALKVLILMVTFGYFCLKLIQITSLPFKDFIANLSFDRRSTLFFLLTGLSISNVLNYLWKIEIGIKIKVRIYAIIRSVFFCYLLLLFFTSEIPFPETISLLCGMNLSISLIPIVFILDFVVGSEVAVWLFSFVSVSKLTILSTVLSIWLLNFAFPSIWGRFYVTHYKLETR